MEVGLLDLEGLTNEERTIILNVIRRDDEVCRRLETRIKQLKAELHDIRMKSALRTGDDLSKMCARCHMIFGIFVNTGDICPGCHFRVCKNCRENLISHGWMCILCFRENQIRWLTGEWMGKDKTGKSKQIRATDLVRASLRIRHENSAAGDEKSSSEEHSRPAEGDSSSSINGVSENGRREEISPVTKFVPSGAANAVPADSVHSAGVVLSPSDVHARSFSLPQCNQHGAVTVPLDQESMQAKGDQKQKNGDESSCGEQKDMFTMDTTSLSGLERKSLKESDTKSQDKNDKTCHENTSSVLHEGGQDGKSCIVDMCSQAGNTREVNKESESLVEAHVEHISHHHGAGEEQFEGRVISLVPEAGESTENPLAALRAPKNELPYTLQLFLRCNSTTSDTLSIISELSEPNESCHEDYLGDERDRDLLDDDEGSDDTVCNEPHVSWSDATHAGFNVEKSEDKEALLLDEEGVVGNRNGSRVEVASEGELHASSVCDVCPPLEAFSQKVYFAGKGVRDVEEGTRAGDVEAKVEETSSSSSQTKPIHDGGLRSEVKQNSLSSEKEDEKHSSQVGGDALMINADEAEKEKNQDLRRDFKGSVHAAAAIVDKENAFDDEENLCSSSSSTTVQENISQEEINRNVIINTPYERNVIIDTPVIIDTTYEKKVSDEVDKQPIESELVLESGLGQEPNLIVEFIEEKSNADEGKEVPCTVTQIVSNTQREIKPLVTGTDGTPSIPEQSGAGYCGQNVTAAAGRVTDTTVPPKPVDLGQKVVPAAGTLPVIITTIAENDSDKGIATDTGRLPFASPKLRLSDVPDGAESQQKLPPDISISRPVDADSAGSEHSGSPEKRSSPHRNSHLSIHLRLQVHSQDLMMRGLSMMMMIILMSCLPTIGRVAD
ncbi:uncharacterized protein LOC112566429 isoform X2 [Pomacea canaliculata]|uniref:uncharacterized protein LOC112566429 isoform X2 n=1 Tax=Pomacea canaliculata TaxID=400727 RepID=UPI000D73631C|nr:uncharacterized protein LOC112566429 isoform X2 [Pomacea canaliculata]